MESIGCDDDGSITSSALVGSHVALKTDAGTEDSAADVAEEPFVFLYHVLVLLMASQSAEAQNFIAFVLAYIGALVTFCTPAAAFCSADFQHVRIYIKFL